VAEGADEAATVGRHAASAKPKQAGNKKKKHRHGRAQ
jgi:hypothetical protein